MGRTVLEFCDKCGALMLPVKKERKTVLKCRECGHEKKAERSPKYKVEYRIRHSPKEKIVVVEPRHDDEEDLSEDEKREKAKEILEFFDEEETE